MRISGLFVSAVIAAAMPVAVRAAVIAPASAVASSAYPTYVASDAIDTGANKYVTDWAADGTGDGSYIDLDLGAAYRLGTALVTDRTTSGGGNDGFTGGTTDFTTEFSIQAFTDATFTTASGAALEFGKTTPVAPASPADFLYAASLGGLDGEFLRYTVITANGVNPGLADIEFTTVPEPASLVLLGAGLLGLAGLRRRA